MKCFSFVFFLFVWTVCVSQNSREQSIESLMDKGFQFYSSDIDSCYAYLGKAKKIGYSTNDIENLCTIYNVESWFASTYGDLERMRSNMDSLDNVLNRNKESFNALPNKEFYKSQTTYTKGMYNYMLKEYSTARSYFKDIIKITRDVPDSVLVGDFFDILLETNIYFNLMCVHEGKYEQAQEYLNNNLRLIKTKGADESVEYNTLMQLANIYRQQGNYSKANKTIHKCLPYYLRQQGSSNRIITAYHRIVENHVDLNRQDSASIYLAKIKEILNSENPFIYRYHNAVATVQEKNGNYSEALKSLNKSLVFLREKWENRPHPEVATAYYKIGQLASRSERPNEALVSYNNALDQLSLQKNASTIENSLRLEIYKDKSKTLNSLGQFAQALQTTSEAVSTLDFLKPSFRTQEDKLFLIDNAYPLFENAIEAIYERYSKTKAETLIEEAFFYFEKSKNTLLLEAVIGSNTSKFANIPHKILEKERQFQAHIRNLEKRLHNTSNVGIESELFQAKSDYRTFLEELEKEYPQYFDLKYNAKVIGLDLLKENLKSEENLITYFYGNRAIYALAITSGKNIFHKILLSEELVANITSTIEMLKDPKSDLSQLNLTTYDLYIELVAPLLKAESTTSTTILLDGLLNYIPFGGLSTDGGSHYLIENKTISYANSATLLSELKAKENNDNSLLGFAPEFSSKSTLGLLPLPTNKNEIKSALSYFGGSGFINSDATVANFLSESPSYGIIHLATHAIYNDDSPEFSYLAFTESNTRDSLLYTNDLYSLKLKANLVTLSACDSGNGELRRGEGLLSLARGFYYAGAGSIASTLWKINDKPSSDIMSHFYGAMSEGASKSEALQKAKLKFISKNKNNSLSHPYHWAGFVISGNTAPVVARDDTIWYYLGGIALVLIVIIILKRRVIN